MYCGAVFGSVIYEYLLFEYRKTWYGENALKENTLHYF